MGMYQDYVVAYRLYRISKGRDIDTYNFSNDEDEACARVINATAAFYAEKSYFAQKDNDYGFKGAMWYPNRIVTLQMTKACYRAYCELNHIEHKFTMRNYKQFSNKLIELFYEAWFSNLKLSFSTERIELY